MDLMEWKTRWMSGGSSLLHLLVFLSLLQDQAVALDVYSFQKEGVQSDAHILYSGPAGGTEGQGWRRPFNPEDFSVCLRLRFFYLWDLSGFLQMWGDVEEDSPTSVFSAELNLRYFRVRMGIFRRLFFLGRPLRALTWYHVCITYSEDTLEFYLNGDLQGSQAGRPEYPVGGTRLKVGAWDAVRSFSGEITEVNVWSRALAVDEVASLVECKGSAGDLVAWTDAWTMHGDVTKADVPSERLCSDRRATKQFLFPPVSSKAAFQVCEGLGGSVTTPRRAEVEDLRRLLSGFPDNETCSRLWTGVTDVATEGEWTYHKNGLPAQVSWRPGAPDGDVLQNCAAIYLEGSSDGLTDVSCSRKLCAVCDVPEGLVWTLLGACEEFPRNIHFVARQRASGEFHFRGYSSYMIMRNDTDGRWVWWDRQRNEVVAILSENEFGFPMGRHSWALQRPVCGRKPPVEHVLLLTPCGAGSFSCDDATCIPLYQRCDLKFDCRDKSDESGCELVQFPPVYRPDLPPSDVASAASAPLPVGVRMVLESADVRTSTMMIHINYNLTLTWREGRSTTSTLNKDYTLNRVPYNTMRELWVPTVDFTNTRGNHITHADEEATMMVLMSGEPTMGGDTRPQEVEVYSGWENPLTVRRKYSETFQCEFDLSMYPFDQQPQQPSRPPTGMPVRLTMLSASSRLLVFDEGESEAVFVGNPHLVEYTVGGVSVDLVNQMDFAVMHSLPHSLPSPSLPPPPSLNLPRLPPPLIHSLTHTLPFSLPPSPFLPPFTAFTLPPSLLPSLLTPSSPPSHPLPPSLPQPSSLPLPHPFFPSPSPLPPSLPHPFSSLPSLHPFLPSLPHPFLPLPHPHHESPFPLFSHLPLILSFTTSTMNSPFPFSISLSPSLYHLHHAFSFPCSLLSFLSLFHTMHSPLTCSLISLPPSLYHLHHPENLLSSFSLISLSSLSQSR
ncbi:hypothetical protein C7M84_006373 [Penaeus vannamei]|uniref:C-type lectin domain-containing protein n=1 Tax=Penaeus vannamei TaxID=6689 RepID=A0A3R7QR26_PENVA|nr:hypothetical protein C7M84_006373 [Penaeus vannamei]